MRLGPPCSRLELENFMSDYVEPAEGGAVIAIVVVGLLAGVTASVLWLIMGVFIYGGPLYWVLFVYAGAGIAGAVVTAAILVFLSLDQEDREWLVGSETGQDFNSATVGAGGSLRGVLMSDKDQNEFASAAHGHAEFGDQGQVAGRCSAVNPRSDAGADISFSRNRDVDATSIQGEATIVGALPRAVTPDGVLRRPPYPSQSTELRIDRLFRRVTEIDEDGYGSKTRNIGYFGDYGDESFAAISGWANQTGQAVVAVPVAEVEWSTIKSCLDRVDLCFIDAGVMGDVEDTISFCLMLRSCAPGIQLILISSEAQGHDLTAERAVTCDVTLKPPLTERAIKAGVAAAENNSRSRLSVSQPSFRKKNVGRA